MKLLLLLLLVGCRAPDAIGLKYDHGVAEGNGQNGERETGMTTDSDFAGIYFEWDGGEREKAHQAQIEQAQSLKIISERPAPPPSTIAVAPVVVNPVVVEKETAPPAQPEKAPASATPAEPTEAQPTTGAPWWAVYLPTILTVVLALIGILNRSGHVSVLSPKAEE